MSQFGAAEHGIIHSRSQALIDFAYAFAEDAHRGVCRDYTGEPYITHPLAVAKLVASVTDDCETICAAFLHDVIEDCGVTRQKLCDVGFRWNIANLVVGMTDVSKPEDGNRAVRKLIDRVHTENQCPRVKTIKLADLIHNSESILRYGKGFAKVYIAEMTLLLEVLKEGDATLYVQAKRIVDSYNGISHCCQCGKHTEQLAPDNKCRNCRDSHLMRLEIKYSS